jgi:hypothetical protein
MVSTGAATNIRKFEPELNVSLKYMPQWVNVKIRPAYSTRFEIFVDNEEEEPTYGGSTDPDLLVYYKNR